MKIGIGALVAFIELFKEIILWLFNPWCFWCAECGGKSDFWLHQNLSLHQCLMWQQVGDTIWQWQQGLLLQKI